MTLDGATALVRDHGRPVGTGTPASPRPADTSTHLDSAAAFPEDLTCLTMVQPPVLHSRITRRLDHDYLTDPAGPHPRTLDRRQQLLEEFDTGNAACAHPTGRGRVTSSHRHPIEGALTHQVGEGAAPETPASTICLPRGFMAEPGCPRTDPMQSGRALRQHRTPRDGGSPLDPSLAAGNSTCHPPVRQSETGDAERNDACQPPVGLLTAGQGPGTGPRLLSMR